MTVSAVADDRADRFEARTFDQDGLGTIRYRLLSPHSLESGHKYPLVIFLHGAGERGDDNNAQLVHVVKELASDEMMDRSPCFVVAPQCPNGHRWVEVDWGLDAHDMPEVPSKPLALVMALVDHFQIAQPIDPDRIYVVGLSMGGFGTWDLLQRQSEKYAAAVPICGGGDPTYAKKIGTVPIWAFHGDQDTVVKPHRSREMVQALRELGNPVIHTEYPGIGHNSWTPTAENRLVWDWLFAQRRRSEIEKDQP